ncbi:fluoride efflux transporter CrcB [Oceanobacillus neutriphilus]|uniref:Fluoride-specific ion channel FluC n=1 Tax=Oceanobacillus neutriphilus TaxID=531815 RepID=A0ABQ2NQJ5_9BACI|nr:fluoride efflux transporter CrcB [Oceanobacillus neutriphilus]GGP07232.1 putative fluoride ion transporter CrcB 1 [Oceanobacillus neutriphilus]
MFLVGLGGAAGALLRYIISEYMNVVRVEKGIIFPVATWIINMTGSFLLGILYGLDLPSQLWLLLGVGFCGGYTTFSTFGKEVIDLLMDKQWRVAFLYILASALLSIIAAWVGIAMVHLLV